MRRCAIVVLAVIVTLGLLSSNSWAQGKGKGKGKPRVSEKVDKQDKGAAKHNGREQGWERKDGFELRMYGANEGRPPGWNRGNKTGWGNCGLPPGQAKKMGACRTYVYGGHRYFYYEDNGRMVVRRVAINVAVH